MGEDLVKISKFLCYVLRHRPDVIGLTLDANGWASVAELIERAKSAARVELSEAVIRDVVRNNDKKRFALSDDRTRIRASQGHSVTVDLALEPKEPPELLFHGTATRFADAIRRDGLRAMSRRHVHLFSDEATATAVGRRHGKPLILRVRAGDMHRGGTKFYLSANGVWLTEAIEAKFIDFPAENA